MQHVPLSNRARLVVSAGLVLSLFSYLSFSLGNLCSFRSVCAKQLTKHQSPRETACLQPDSGHTALCIAGGFQEMQAGGRQKADWKMVASISVAYLPRVSPLLPSRRISFFCLMWKDRGTLASCYQNLRNTGHKGPSEVPASHLLLCRAQHFAV